MVQRSREEIAYCAYLLRALGRPCTHESLEACLSDGARNGLWDACVRIDAHTILWIDYDGGYRHDASRVPADVAKTVRKLDESACNRVLRVRMNAPPLDFASDARVEAAHTDSRHAWQQIVDTRAAIMRLLPNEVAEGLRVSAVQKNPVIDGVVHDVMLAVDERLSTVS